MDRPEGTETAQVIYRRCMAAVDGVLEAYGIRPAARSRRIVSMAQVQASVIRDDYLERRAAGVKAECIMDEMARDYALTPDMVRKIVKGKR